MLLNWLVPLDEGDMELVKVNQDNVQINLNFNRHPVQENHVFTRSYYVQ